MASTKRNRVDDLFRAVASGSVGDLHEIFKVEKRKESIKLAHSYNEMGETPLLVAISKRKLHAMKILVEKMEANIGQTGHFTSNGIEYAECPPLFAAIVSDQLQFFEYLFKSQKTREKPSLDFDSFLSSSITCRQKINILKLIGAAYLSRNWSSFLHGLSYWKKAVTLSSSTADAEESQVPVFQFMDSTSEVMALEQMERMARHETVFDRRFVVEQALIASQRILIDLQLFPNMFIISQFAYYSLTVLPSPRQFQHQTRDELQHLSKAIMYTLKLLKVWYEKSNPNLHIRRQDFRLTEEAMCLSRTLFECLRMTVPDYGLSFRDMTFVFDLVCQQMHKLCTKPWPAKKRILPTLARKMARWVLDYSTVMFHSFSLFSQEECQQFKQRLFIYVHLYQESETFRPNLLHEACHLSYVCHQKEPNYNKFVQLFLDAGEDPNATDSQGNTPLHCLLAKNPFEHWLTNTWDNQDGAEHNSIVSINYVALTRLLLDSGCHVDHPNEAGETVLELLKRSRKIQQQNFNKPFDHYLESVINTVLPLSCYSAQVIRKQNISTEELFPALQLFVRRH